MPSSDDSLKISRVEGVSGDTLRTQKAQANEELLASSVQEESAAEEWDEWADYNLFNPFVMARRFEPLDQRIKRRGKEEETEQSKRKEEGDEDLLPIEKIQEAAEDF